MAIISYYIIILCETSPGAAAAGHGRWSRPRCGRAENCRSSFLPSCVRKLLLLLPPPLPPPSFLLPPSSCLLPPPSSPPSSLLPSSFKFGAASYLRFAQLTRSGSAGGMRSTPLPQSMGYLHMRIIYIYIYIYIHIYTLYIYIYTYVYTYTYIHVYMCILRSLRMLERQCCESQASRQGSND